MAEQISAPTKLQSTGQRWVFECFLRCRWVSAHHGEKQRKDALPDIFALVHRWYYFLCKDIELACDEYAIKDMSDSQRAAYSQTLLSCTANQRIFAACPLAFGSKNVKTRIRAVLSYRKPHTWIITVTAILVLAVVACFMTNPRQPKESTAQGSNYIDLNQPPTLDVIQNGQTISDRSSSEDRQREVELESALLGEAIKKQESLTQIQTTDFYR